MLENNKFLRRSKIIMLVVVLFSNASLLRAQQFNSDNYLTMPHGTGTFVITAGQRNATLLSSFAFIPKFEFFFQGNLFRDYRVENYVQHFTTTVYWTCHYRLDNKLSK